MPRAKGTDIHAFVFKNKYFDYFIVVSRKVMRGEICYLEAKTIPAPKGVASLNGREMEVLRLVCKNLSAREIARNCFSATTQ